MKFTLLNRLLQSSKEFNHQKLRECGLNETECRICSFVAFHPNASQDDVVRGLLMDKTTVAKALQTLESDDYITRETHMGDRRKKTLNITEFGRARCKDLLTLHDRWLEEVLSVLKSDERTQFEAYCLRLLDKAEEMAKGEKKLSRQ